MIGYHPAMDPAHAAFRTVRLLLLAPDADWEAPRLRIADFMLVFPGFIASMRLPRDAQNWRVRFRQRENRYWSSGDPLMLFSRVRPLHEAGTHLLVGVGAVEERTWVRARRARLIPSALPESVLGQAQARNEQEADVSRFLKEVLVPLPLSGPNGLKARTSLLEYRYDED